MQTLYTPSQVKNKFTTKKILCIVCSSLQETHKGKK